MKKSLWIYTLKRLLSSVFVIFLVTVLIFVTVRACPGDPVTNKIGPYGDRSPENIARVEEQLGLDKPYAVQYLIWLRDCLRGDLGVSLRNGMPITDIVFEKLVVSLELIVTGLILALVIAVPIGILAGIRKESVFDKLTSAFSTSFLAMPSFCVGLFLISLLSVTLGLLPSNGYVPFRVDPVGNIRCLIMPAVTLGLFVSASIFKFVRADTIEVSHANFIKTAVAKGLPMKMVYGQHLLRNIAVTIVTVTGMEFATLLGGSVIIEQLYGWSGLGWYICSSVSNRDYPAVQGSVLIIAVMFVLINLTVDILYAWIDPRIELE